MGGCHGGWLWGRCGEFGFGRLLGPLALLGGAGRLLSRERHGALPVVSDRTPRQVLDERLARGEISLEEYERIPAVLER